MGDPWVDWLLWSSLDEDESSVEIQPKEYSHLPSRIGEETMRYKQTPQYKAFMKQAEENAKKWMKEMDERDRRIIADRIEAKFSGTFDIPSPDDIFKPIRKK